MKIFAAVALAVCMSAGAASAAAPAKMHHKMMHHMMAACAEGAAAKASCVCKSATGAQVTCKAGQWCHSFIGMCTQ